MLKNNLTARERTWIFKEKEGSVILEVKKGKEVLMEFTIPENILKALVEKEVVIVK